MSPLIQSDKEILTHLRRQQKSPGCDLYRPPGGYGHQRLAQKAQDSACVCASPCQANASASPVCERVRRVRARARRVRARTCEGGAHSRRLWSCGRRRSSGLARWARLSSRSVGPLGAFEGLQPEQSRCSAPPGCGRETTCSYKVKALPLARLTRVAVIP